MLECPFFSTYLKKMKHEGLRVCVGAPRGPAPQCGAVPGRGRTGGGVGVAPVSALNRHFLLYSR